MLDRCFNIKARSVIYLLEHLKKILWTVISPPFSIMYLSSFWGALFDTLFCYLLHVQVVSTIRSCTRWRSDMEQNYLGVLGIIWTAGWDFPIIGFCDTVLWHSVAGMISDDVGKLESGKWRVKTCPPPHPTCLTTINPTWYVLHSLFFLPLFSGPALFIQNEANCQLSELV